MKIGYIGNFRFPHCTEVHVTLELEAMGHQVLRLQEDELWYLPALDSQLRDYGAEMLLYTRTWSVRPEDDMFRWLRGLSIPTVGFTLDLFFGIREEMLEADPIFACDYVFTADGGHQDEFRLLGINHYWSPPAIYSGEVGLGQYQARFAHRVAFAGSQADGYHKQWPWRGQLLASLVETYGSDFTRYGPGSYTVRGPELASLYASADVLVGDSLLLGPHYWSDRVYETVGRGGLLVHPFVPELAQQLQDVVLFYQVGDLADVHSCIKHMLNMSDDERESRRQRGIETVGADHTYRNRMNQLLEVVCGG